jgi:hypothetical protein
MHSANALAGNFTAIKDESNEVAENTSKLSSKGSCFLSTLPRNLMQHPGSFTEHSSGPAAGQQ